MRMVHDVIRDIDDVDVCSIINFASSRNFALHCNITSILSFFSPPLPSLPLPSRGFRHSFSIISVMRINASHDIETGASARSYFQIPVIHRTDAFSEITRVSTRARTHARLIFTHNGS